MPVFDTPKITITTVIPFIVNRVRSNYVRFGDQFPAYGDGDTHYRLTQNQNWLAAFWAGMLWLVAHETQDSEDIERARSTLASFVNRLDQKIRLNHDLGFLYTLSARAQWQITGDSDAHALALRAAEILLSRFRTQGNYIQAWDSDDSRDERGRFIIDCMMNLPLLYWASRETQDKKYLKAATAHALTSARYLLREDGSTYHTYIFDPMTGTPIGPKTHQGYADDSLWARGQAWALYGFTLAAQWTGDDRLQQAATDAADCYLRESQSDAVSPWDFHLPPDETGIPDSSADAIAASGLLRLSALTGAEVYKDEAAARIHMLMDQALDLRKDAQGLLRHGTQHMPHNYGIDTYTIFGDYFFFEAVTQLVGQVPDFWGPASK